MPIRFRCLTCHKSLSSASSLAGKRIVCPVCKTHLTVPPDESQAVCTPAIAELPSKLPDEPRSDNAERPVHVAVWAGGVAVVLIALSAALGMVLRSSGPQPEVNESLSQADSHSLAQVDDLLNLNEFPDVATDSLDIAETAEAGEPTNADRAALSANVNGQESPSIRTADLDPKPDPKVPAAPPAGAERAKLIAASPEMRTASSVRERWMNKRRSRLTDNELRQQLLLPPEVDLEAAPGTTRRVISQSPKAIAAGVDLIPRLSAGRPDLIGLPLHTGSLARMSTEEALNLKVLSGRLRLIIQEAIPGALDEIVDPRPDHEMLRRLLLNSPLQSLWLRPLAISTLRQLLISEHRNVRLVLVDLLKNIDGRVASAVLAERAVFDLDGDVRLAALMALASRPVAEYESALIAGLRYPWPAIADHAAEALVALNLKSSVPKLVTMLDTRDLGEPYPVSFGQSRRAVVPELVRVNHLRNCLLCHAYSNSLADPVRGLVPNAEHRVPLPVAGARTDTKGWGGGGRPSVSIVTSTFVRPDITFLRQDFSVVQPVGNHGKLWPAEQRYDYLVRLRPINAKELSRWQDKLDTVRTSSLHGESLLFALRELTGEGASATSADWKRLYSTVTGRRFETPMEASQEPKHLKDSLVEGSPKEQAERLALFREKTGPAYEAALAQAIPELSAELQKTARIVLADHLFCLPVRTIAEKLKDTDAEIRRAGVSVTRQRKLKSLVPDLIDLLDDSNVEIAAQVHHLLQQFTAKNLGPKRGADHDARVAAMTAWRGWWEQQTQRQTAQTGASQ